MLRRTFEKSLNVLSCSTRRETASLQHHQEANRTGVLPPQIISLSLKLKDPAPSNITFTGCIPSSLKQSNSRAIGVHMFV
jgi:hypothetical protein